MTNFTNEAISSFKIQFNKNYFGISINSKSIFSIVISPNSTNEVKIPIEFNVNSDFTKTPSEKPPMFIETAISCSLDEFYFNIPMLFSTLFLPMTDHISKEDYLNNWKNIVTTNDMCCTINNVHPNLKSSNYMEKKFKENNIYLIHKSEKDSSQGKFLIKYNFSFMHKFQIHNWH